MNAKSSIFSPAVIFACVLGGVGFLFLVWLLRVTITIESDVALLPQKAQLPVSSVNDVVSSLPTQTAPKLKLDGQPTIAQSAQSLDKVAAIAGGLRISNRTDHPLRVALLVTAPTSAASSPKYGEPIHWDFAPGEGGSQGLIVSLPEGNLKLKKGDILVAFAQDGSRRYWGPFVVGETDTPVLNRKTSEWQLILQP